MNLSYTVLVFVLVVAASTLLACGRLSAQTSAASEQSENSSADAPPAEQARGAHAHHDHTGRAEWQAPSEEQYKARLEPLQYEVLRKAGTERPFTGRYWDSAADGVYHCAACGQPLYDSRTKYKSGTGWPSFWAAVEGSIAKTTDYKLFMPRTELLCSRCNSHLGHVFSDGPKPTGKRHCINSAALEFIERTAKPTSQQKSP